MRSVVEAQVTFEESSPLFACVQRPPWVTRDMQDRRACLPTELDQLLGMQAVEDEGRRGLVDTVMDLLGMDASAMGESMTTWRAWALTACRRAVTCGCSNTSEPSLACMSLDSHAGCAVASASALSSRKSHSHSAPAG